MNVVSAHLNHTQFLGLQTDRILSAGAHVITLTEFSDETLPIGAQITFTIDPRHIRIFATGATDLS
jgi:hypothetical protein